jgi:photosystem II stability/assembly factor-like uncharacterized protein
MRCAVAVLLAAFVLGPAAVVAAPFHITWIHGTCRNCVTARYLVSVPFFSGTEAWAIGFNPPGETGTGDASVLHSHNGGRTWSELHRTYTHNDFPTVSFAGPHDGWLMHYDMGEAAQRLMETHDGGRHWRRIQNPDDYLDQVQYLGDGRGVAYAFDIYKEAGSFYATMGAGRWRKVELPTGFTMSQMDFTDLNRGILAGCQDHKVTILSTIDGGATWSTSTLVPRIGDPTSFCNGIGVDHLTISADGHAWLLVTKHGFMKGDTVGYASAWSSADGGRTWASALERQFDVGADFRKLQDFDGPYGLASGLALMPHALAQSHPAILLREGNDGWLEEPLPRPIGGCSTIPVGLACAAGVRDFWVATLSR